MRKFDDYHRTILGYHGTRRSVALEIVARGQTFEVSRNPDDWLGNGVYFWEHAPWQARAWAERRKKGKKWGEPIAVLASMIRLGFCFDLLDPENVRYLKKIYGEFRSKQEAAGAPVRENYQHRKFLDCSVFQYLYAADPSIDSVRAVYVPTGAESRVWTRSWISNDAHIQVCVRNPACILGTWLHFLPIPVDDHGQEENCDASVDVQPPHPRDRQEAEVDEHGGTSPTDGEGGVDDAGGSGSDQSNSR